jgi:hypothetical protein
MNVDEFFLQTLEELRERVWKRPPREYDFAVIGLSLRKLLLDQVVVRVNLKRERVLYRMPANKEYGHKTNWTAQGILSFFDYCSCTDRSAQFMTLMEEISPDMAKSIKVRDLELRDFLKVTVDIHLGEVSTVKDLIDYAAHVFGGAHFSAPRKAEQKRLARSQELLSAPYPLQLGMLQPIGGVVLRALHGIEADVRIRVLSH